MAEANGTGTQATTTTTSPANAGGAGAAGAAAADAGKGSETKPAGAAAATTPTTTGTETKAGESKTTETAPAELVVKFPETVKVDQAVVSGFTDVAKKLGLKSEQAQGIADLYVKLQQDAHSSAMKAFEAEKAAWAQTLKADKDLGGAAMTATTAAAHKAIATYGTPELKAFLDETGLGSHPEVVRFAAKIGKAMAEDSVGDTKGDGANALTPTQLELRRRYPTHFEKKE